MGGAVVRLQGTKPLPPSPSATAIAHRPRIIARLFSALATRSEHHARQVQEEKQAITPVVILSPGGPPTPHGAGRFPSRVGARAPPPPLSHTNAPQYPARRPAWYMA